MVRRAGFRRMASLTLGPGVSGEDRAIIGADKLESSVSRGRDKSARMYRARETNLAKCPQGSESLKNLLTGWKRPGYVALPTEGLGGVGDIPPGLKPASLLRALCGG